MVRLADGTTNKCVAPLIRDPKWFKYREEQEVHAVWINSIGTGDGAGVGPAAWINGDGTSTTHRIIFSVNHGVALMVCARRRR